MLPWLGVPLSDDRLRQQLDGAYRPVHFHPPIAEQKTKNGANLQKSVKKMNETALVDDHDDDEDDDAHARDRPLQVRGSLSAGMAGERRGAICYGGDFFALDLERVSA